MEYKWNRVKTTSSLLILMTRELFFKETIFLSKQLGLLLKEKGFISFALILCSCIAEKPFSIELFINDAFRFFVLCKDVHVFCLGIRCLILFFVCVDLYRCSGTALYYIELYDSCNYNWQNCIII